MLKFQKKENKTIKTQVNEDESSSRIGRFLNKNPWLFFAFFLVFVALLFLPELSMRWIYYMNIGDIATKDVRSPIDVSVLDTVANNRAMSAAASEQRPIYVLNTNVKKSIINRYSSLIDLAENSVSFSRFKDIAGDEYSDLFLRTIYSFDAHKAEIYKKKLLVMINKWYSRRYIIDRVIPGKREVTILTEKRQTRTLSRDSLTTIDELKNDILKYRGGDHDEKLIFSSLVVPNLLYNDELTKAQLNASIKKLKPKYIVIKKNEILLRSGDRVTPEVLKKLNIVRDYRPTRRYIAILAQFINITLLIFLFYLYIAVRNKKVLNNHRYMGLLFTSIVLSILLVRIATMYNLSYYIIPLSFSAIILAIFMEYNLALITAIFSILLSSFFIPHAWNFIIYQFSAVFFGINGVRQINKRSDITNIGVSIAGISIVIILLNMVSIDSIELINLLYGVLHGAIVVVFVTGTLQLFEWSFGLTSNITLLELSNLTHPLLQEFSAKAPGSYHHSLMVGNISAAAAEAIGANALLARVGGYFHDIGKIVKPGYYIENTDTSKDVHKKLSPTLSYYVILAHVKEGAILAKKNKLPREVIDIINQHHGTSVISFFYQKALGLSTEVNEEDFRYPGPKPMSKEAGIVMITDSIEAAVRALAKPNPNRIKSLAREIINQKFLDGQLDMCELTLSDLEKIFNTVVKGIIGIYHLRIEYPKPGGKN